MLGFRKRNIFFVILFFLLVYFLLHDLKELIAFFRFDVNAPDLIDDGVASRNRYFGSYYYPAVLFPWVAGHTTSLLLPVMFLVSLYYYSKVKNKVIKYTIGKSVNVNKYLLKLKLKASLLPLIIFNSVFLVYMLVSYLVTGFYIGKSWTFKNMFLPNTILSFADDSVVWYLILLFLTSTVYIVVSVFLLTTLVDYKYNYIVIFIVYFLVVYLGNDFVNMYINKRLVLTISKSTAYGLRFNHDLYFTYIWIFLAYIFFKFTHKEEF